MEDTELVKIIKFYNKYVKKKQFGNSQLENVLSDCLFRYIHLWEIRNEHGIEKLIDCIKEFHKMDKCKNRFKEMEKLIILPKFNETNRLLLIKSVYYEIKYESI